jgi:hypothetical protein
MCYRSPVSELKVKLSRAAVNPERDPASGVGD